jgi:hypothetical protein
MGKYGEIEGDFLAERTRILQALEQPENRYLSLRMIGALAFRTHCPAHGGLQEMLQRAFTDIDFVAYSDHFKQVIRFLTDLGYAENKMVTRLFGEGRLIFEDPYSSLHLDVFLDKLDFCHVIPLKGRLEADFPTMPLAELLLEKMQIVRINEKDVIDTIMLLREHEIGRTDDETINGTVISKLLANDWGFWRTVTGNLTTVVETMESYPQLAEADRQVVRDRIATLRGRIDAEPKSQRWKVRSTVGERVKWYKDVEELMR